MFYVFFKYLLNHHHTKISLVINLKVRHPRMMIKVQRTTIKQQRMTTKHQRMIAVSEMMESKVNICFYQSNSNFCISNFLVEPATWIELFSNLWFCLAATYVSICSNLYLTTTSFFWQILMKHHHLKMRLVTIIKTHHAVRNRARNPALSLADCHRLHQQIGTGFREAWHYWT